MFSGPANASPRPVCGDARDDHGQNDHDRHGFDGAERLRQIGDNAAGIVEESDTVRQHRNERFHARRVLRGRRQLKTSVVTVQSLTFWSHSPVGRRDRPTPEFSLALLSRAITIRALSPEMVTVVQR